MEADTAEVLVVGAGPTGLLMALLLARQGIRPLIIDKHSGPAQQTRAMGVQARTLEIYAQLGLAEAAVEAGAIAKGIHLWSAGRHQTRLPLGDIGMDLSPYPFVLLLGQDENERLLGRALGQLGVHVRWNTELKSIDQQPDQVIAVLRNANGLSTTVRAAWVAGCDGSNSTVRDACGVRFDGAPYGQVFFVADTVARGSMRPSEINAYLWRTGFHLFFPMRGENRWRVIGMLPTGLRERASLGFSQLIPELRAQAGEALAFEACHWFSTYRIQHRCAERFRVGRCFLLGDAAHVHSPMGAQGMNTGLQDAYNLAWKLSLVIRREADITLLDSYEHERRAVAQALLRGTDRAFGLVVSDHPWAALFRTRVMANLARMGMRFRQVRAIAFRLLSQTGIRYRSSPLSRVAGLQARSAPRHGDRFPWFRVTVTADQGSVDIYRLLDDRRFTLLQFGDATVARYPQSLISVVQIPASDQNAEALEKARLHAPACYLVRPDGYIAWSSSRLDVRALFAYLEGIGIRMAPCSSPGEASTSMAGRMTGVAH